VCSFRHPVCVHGEAGVTSDRLLGALTYAERAWDTLTGPLGLPAPDASLDGSYDIYLVDLRGEGDAFTDLADRDPRGSYDRASAFTRIERAASGCALERLVAREVARAALFRSAPATDLGSARAQASHLAHLMAPCAAGAPEGAEVFQAHPERAIIDPWPESPIIGERFDDGAALFFGWLDATFGTSPGAIVRGLWALTPTSTPWPSARFAGRPDVFDVLRASFKGALGTHSTLDDLLVEFAIARLFFGGDDPHAFEEARALGDIGAVHVDWDIPWPEKGRRFQSPVGVAPTGSTYVSIHTNGAPKGARLRLEATWEEHARMRWVALKLDAAGHEKGRFPITSYDRGTDAQMTLVDLEGTARVVVIGVSLGDPDLPFDPNDGVWEPHGWLLTVLPE
jgi:hypothetical protein